MHMSMQHHSRTWCWQYPARKLVDRMRIWKEQ